MQGYPVVRNLILDSLTYWIDVMGVDGYRFDLAPVLGREGSGTWAYNKDAKTIKDIIALGQEKEAEMIAEAWDIGTYQVGNFPDGWGRMERTIPRCNPLLCWNWKPQCRRW